MCEECIDEEQSSMFLLIVTTIRDTQNNERTVNTKHKEKKQKNSHTIDRTDTVGSFVKFLKYRNLFSQRERERERERESRDFQGKFKFFITNTHFHLREKKVFIFVGIE